MLILIEAQFSKRSDSQPVAVLDAVSTRAATEEAGRMFAEAHCRRARILTDTVRAELRAKGLMVCAGGPTCAHKANGYNGYPHLYPICG